MRASSRAAVLCAVALVASGCGGSRPRTGSGEPSIQRAAPRQQVDDHGRCQTSGTDREVSEYDTSGDDHPDVRRVYLRRGDPPLVRLILACREADLNGDGVKDVVRFYNDEGRPLREEADRNFDGRLDSFSYFQEGRVVRQELDSSGSGRIDTKIFFEGGAIIRTERDLAGRSTESSWRPDRWEYFEGGHMVRMGTDLDGDGTVDRWDRDAVWSERQRQLEEQAGTVGDESAEGGGAEDDAASAGDSAETAPSR
jgi:hypothetical protein